MTTKQVQGACQAPDGSQYVTLTDGAGNLVSTSTAIGLTPIIGGASTQILFNLGGSVSSDSGFTYAGSNGAVTTAGVLRTSSAGTAAAPSLSIGNLTTGLFSVSTTGFAVSVNGTNQIDFGITTGNRWTFNVGTFTNGNVGLPATNVLNFSGAGGITSGGDGGIKVQNNAGTNTFTLAATGNAAPIKFVDAGSFSADGSVATVLGSLGPVGSHTTVQTWLTIVDNGGSTRYIPCF